MPDDALVQTVFGDVATQPVYFGDHVVHAPRQCPLVFIEFRDGKIRHAGRLRSDDLPLTRRLLCQLSYGSGTGILHACPVADFPKTSQTKEEKQVGFSGERAIDRIRTGDLRITRALLCQLSYDGETVPA